MKLHNSVLAIERIALWLSRDISRATHLLPIISLVYDGVCDQCAFQGGLKLTSVVSISGGHMT